MKEYIENKTVAFVGMSPNIMGKGLGKEIDSFDTVIRTNFYPIENYLQPHYGSKCTIISVLHRWSENICEEWRDLDVKMVITVAYSVKNKIDGLKYYECSWGDLAEVRSVISDYVGHKAGDPSIGAYFICKALSYDPVKLKVFGVTGYQNEKKELADHTDYNHYVIRRSDVPKGRLKSIINHPYHDFKTQNEYFRLLLESKAMEMDEYSIKYFI